MSIPGYDTPPPHPDQWVPMAGTAPDSGLACKWPYGLSRVARAALEAGNISTFTGTSRARTTARPAHMTLDPDGAYRLPDVFAIIGPIDWSGVKVRGRTLIWANPWFDRARNPSHLPLEQYLPWRMAHYDDRRPRFHQLDGAAKFSAPGCQLDIENVVILGGGADVNETGWAHSLFINGTPGAGASFKIRLRYEQGTITNQTGTATITTAAISLTGLAGTPAQQTVVLAGRINAALRALETNADGSDRTCAQGGYCSPRWQNAAVSGNPQARVFSDPAHEPMVFVLDHNDQLTLDDNATNLPMQIVEQTGAGFTIDTSRRPSNMANAKALEVGGTDSLNRLNTDPLSSSGYPSGFNNYVLAWSLSDRFGMGTTALGRLSAWHGTDFGIHCDRQSLFGGGGHQDTDQAAYGSMSNRRIARHRFGLWTVDNSGLFAMNQDWPAGDPRRGTVPSFQYVILENMLMRGRGKGSKFLALDDRGGGAVDAVGWLDSYVDRNARDPMTEQWVAPLERPSNGTYVDLNNGIREVVQDRIMVWPDNTELNPPSGFTGTRRRRASLTGYASATPIPPAGEDGGSTQPPSLDLASAYVWAADRLGKTAAALNVNQKPQYSNVSTGGVAVPNTRTTPTGADGNWKTGTNSDWYAGFLPACFLQLYRRYLAKGDAATAATWLTRAQQHMAGIDSEATRTAVSGMHDLGFAFWAHMLEHRITTDPARRTNLANLIKTAAQTVARKTTDVPPGRYNTVAGAFETFLPNTAQPGVRCIVDMMMDLELLWYASSLDPSGLAFVNTRAKAHADKTLLNQARTTGPFPGSFAHIVEYSRTDGTKVSEAAGQGYDPSPAALNTAAWSRGWAWGIYGFTRAAAYTNLSRFRNQAITSLDAFLAALPAGGLPPWDFHPTGGADAIDTSAAAVVAAAAFDLSSQLASTDAAKSATYQSAAVDLVARLLGSQLTVGTNHPGIIYRGVQNHDAQPESVGKSLILGDNYLLEALAVTPEPTTPVDTVAPATPASFRVTSRGETRIDLAWNASTDNVGVAGYRVYRRLTTAPELAILGTVTGLAYSDTSGLTLATGYRYELAAFDAAGNESVHATLDTATTGDTTNPTDPIAPIAPEVTSSYVRLRLSAGATDAVGVKRYRWWRGDGFGSAANSLLGTTDVTDAQLGLEFIDSTVAPATPYTYKVQAEDAAGNRSNKSPGVDVTTNPGAPPTDTTPPSTPTNLVAEVVDEV